VHKKIRVDFKRDFGAIYDRLTICLLLGGYRTARRAAIAAGW
jgi:hypothetical protein